MLRTLYCEMSILIQAIRNCEKSNNLEWEMRHKEKLLKLCDEFMPSGSGIDSGTKIEIDKCTPNKLVFSMAFHHMDSNGFYTKWSNHDIIVTPSLQGIDLKITGKNVNGIKDYLYELYVVSLEKVIQVTTPV